MKLRFRVDQADCFRRGIDCPKSIVSVEVTPSEVDPKLRELIARRLMGIDVCELAHDEMGTHPRYIQGHPIHVTATGQAWDDLIDAVNRDETKFAEEIKEAKAKRAAYEESCAQIEKDRLKHKMPDDYKVVRDQPIKKRSGPLPPI